MFSADDLIEVEKENVEIKNFAIRKAVEYEKNLKKDKSEYEKYKI